MSSHRVSTVSTEYLLVPVAAERGGTAQDPTGDTVQIAVLPIAVTPTTPDWHTATWETDASTTPPTYSAPTGTGDPGSGSGAPTPPEPGAPQKLGDGGTVDWEAATRAARDDAARYRTQLRDTEAKLTAKETELKTLTDAQLSDSE